MDEILYKIADEMYIKMDCLDEKLDVLKSNQHKINEYAKNRDIIIRAKLEQLLDKLNRMEKGDLSN